MERLYYVAPRESKDYILKNGIFTPKKVRELIDKKELPYEVLGISYKDYDKSNFLEYVSLIRDHNICVKVAQALCYSRTKRFEHPEFIATGFCVSPEIIQDKKFLDAQKTKEMNQDCYPGECLFKGDIELKYINEHIFAIRPYFY